MSNLSKFDAQLLLEALTLKERRAEKLQAGTYREFMLERIPEVREWIVNQIGDPSFNSQETDAEPAADEAPVA